MTKLLSAAAATLVGLWIVIQSFGLMGGGSELYRLQAALNGVNPARIETVAPVIEAFTELQVELTRENIDATVKASLDLRKQLNIDLRLFSNIRRSQEFGAAIGKSLAAERERVVEIVTAAGFESEEQYYKTLGTIAALYPATLVGDTEKKVHEEFAKAPAELDKLATMAPAFAEQLAPVRQIVEGYVGFVTAKPGNVKMVLSYKGKIETVIGALDKDTLTKLGTNAIMGGKLN